jgi:cytochrome c-type biogenesis protein CcmH
MLLWFLFAVMAAAVVWAVTRPLLAGSADGAAAGETELAVYRDQLAEIVTERDQGLLGGAEAEAARVEVARRLIRTSEETSKPKTATGQSTWVRRSALAAAAALPVLAIGIYVAVGSPALPGRPYAARIDAPVEQATAADLVAKVEAHLRKNPDDGRGWDVLAPVYMRMGDFQHAADAFERATGLLGESPGRLTGFARATVMMENGIVSEPARKAFEKLRKLKPDAVEPQVWLAIAREQDGDLAGAAAAYNALAATNPKEPWHSLLEERIRGVNMKLVDTPAVGVPQPSGDDAEGGKPNFHTMTPEQRNAVIDKMVAGLATRLKSDPKDLAGWMQLVRSYVVLGRADDANAALAEARKNLADDKKALAQLQALAQVLGIDS